MEAYLGIDVGSVTTKLAALDESDELITHVYLLTQGKPIEMVQRGLRQIQQRLTKDTVICGVATTGSARYLAGVIVGADLVKNEITCHAVAALRYDPQIQTIIEMFRAKVVDISHKFLTVELTGPEQKVEAFIDICRPYGVKDVVRTGMIALPRHSGKAGR